MGKVLSIALGIFVLISLFIVHEESETVDHPNTQIRKAILLLCIATSLIIGFLINLNF
jgi:hypothetical protein